MSRVYVVGTFDTKGAELLYLADCVRATGLDVTTVDVGIRDSSPEADVPSGVVADHHPGGAAAVRDGDRAEAVSAMALALTRFVAVRDDVAGMIGVGGSSGAAMIAPAMRSLPIGTPKLLVSPVAAGDVAAYVGSSDIAIMYPVTDLGGLNRITRRVLANAAHAVAGMASHDQPPSEDDRAVIALTTLGLTTPCVSAVARELADEFECQLFPAAGGGVRSLRALLRSELIDGVLDLTPSDVAGAVVRQGTDDLEGRFADVASAGVPYLASCGGLDMVIFPANQPIPGHLAGRSLHAHTASVRLMRTSVEECTRIGAALAGRLNDLPGPVHVVIPERGLSALDAPGGPFHDPEADAALFEALEDAFVPGPGRGLSREPYAINDPRFADAVVGTYREMVRRLPTTPGQPGASPAREGISG